MGIFSLFLISFSSLFSQTKQPDPTCGPNSLLLVCQKLKVNTTLDELKGLSDYDEIKGTTMEGLYKAAQLKGLYAVGMKIGFDDLAKLKIPAIAYLWDNHCVVIDGFEENKLRVINYPKETRLIPKEGFIEIYSGFSLLISKNKSFLPKFKTKGSDIRFDEYVYNFGVLEQGEKKEIERIFKFRNTGNQNLAISQVRACCGSSANLLSEKTIPPKGEGEIKATFDVGGRRGEQNYSVSVYSNDPVTPVVKLQVKGFLSAEPIKTRIVIFPPSINFGEVNKGTVLSKKTQILEPEDEQINIDKIELSSKYLSVKISPKENKSYKGIEKDYRSFELEVTLNADSPEGKLEEKITLYTTNEEHPTIEIPVYALIK